MYWIPLVLVVLSAAGVAFGVGHAREQKGPLNIIRLLESGRSRLRLMLFRIEREPAPDQIMGAMCYEPAAVPNRADYVCPVCGERTLYGYPEGYFILESIPPMRRIIEEMEGNDFFSATLGETYCSVCHPGNEVRGVTLVIAYPEGDTVRTAVTLHDLRILEGFISGGLSYTDYFDALLPLRGNTDRLRTLLGIE
ncbi:MAG: hypothetical protein R6V62_10615 [Candidatus Fermentibacteraceae bacterium]